MLEKIIKWFLNLPTEEVQGWDEDQVYIVD